MRRLSHHMHCISHSVWTLLLFFPRMADLPPNQIQPKVWLAELRVLFQCWLSSNMSKRSENNRNVENTHAQHQHQREYQQHERERHSTAERKRKRRTLLNKKKGTERRRHRATERRQRKRGAGEVRISSGVGQHCA